MSGRTRSPSCLLSVHSAPLIPTVHSAPLIPSTVPEAAFAEVIVGGLSSGSRTQLEFSKARSSPATPEALHLPLCFLFLCNFSLHSAPVAIKHPICLLCP